MSFGILRTIANTVQTRPGIRVPAPIENRQTFRVPSPVRLLPRVKNLPVIPPQAPDGTHEVTTIIQNQRFNVGLTDFVNNFIRGLRK